MTEGATLETLLWVCAVAATAPILQVFLRGRLPQVVLLLLGGVLIGPQALGLGHPETIGIFSEVGLGFLFLIAGYEVEPRLLREQQGTRAVMAWVTSLLVSLTAVGVLAATGFVRAYVAVAIGLTTTALGILLPLLREHSLTDGRFGRSVMATGAVGEVLPVMAIAIFLGTRGHFVAIVSLAVVALLAVLLVLLPRRLRGTWLDDAFRAHLDSTSQTSVRATLLLLVLFLVVASRFGLDVVLGAFLAGVVLRMLGPPDADALQHKLDVIGYGFFIPVFFVTSGMSLDIASIARTPQRLVVFLVLLLVVRGVPTYVAYGGLLPPRERVQLGLLAGTALPLLVAITEIGLRNGTMLPANAAALVGAGVVSVLIFPAVAMALRVREPQRPLPLQRLEDERGRSGRSPQT